jgi:hypothetical protein
MAPPGCESGKEKEEAFITAVIYNPKLLCLKDGDWSAHDLLFV